MRKRRWLERAAAAALCLLLCAACLPAAALASGLPSLGDCTLTLDFAPEGPAAGASFQIYRVADILTEGGVSFKFTDEYRYPIGGDGVDWLTRAATLAGFVARDSHLHTPDGSGVIGADGKLTMSGLPQGLYLVMGGRFRTANGYYDPMPYLISLPYSANGGAWQTVVESSVKYEGHPLTPVPEPPQDDQEVRVIKVWADNGYQEQRPQEITVDLLRDGQVYDTVTLGSGENWRYGWTGLDGNSSWQAVERTGDGYGVAVNRTGNMFVITNTYGDDTDIFDEDPPHGKDPDDPGDPEDPGGEELPEEDITDEETPLTNLPQTGQLWWPVPILGLGGLFLLLLGCVRRRRWSDEE